jgi:hypothetical protein
MSLERTTNINIYKPLMCTAASIAMELMLLKKARWSSMSNYSMSKAAGLIFLADIIGKFIFDRFFFSKDENGELIKPKGTPDYEVLAKMIIANVASCAIVWLVASKILGLVTQVTLPFGPAVAGGAAILTLTPPLCYYAVKWLLVKETKNNA